MLDRRPTVIRTGDTRIHFLKLAADVVDQGVKRVGLIGSGWYGKCDLLRLIQVSPVEVVSLCDPDQRMLAGIVSSGGRNVTLKMIGPNAEVDAARADFEAVLSSLAAR